MKLPRTRTVWCVTPYGSTETTCYDTEQAAVNQWRHIGEDKAVLWLGAELEEGA